MSRNYKIRGGQLKTDSKYGHKLQACGSMGEGNNEKRKGVLIKK
jgi:hypothetical protein